MDQMFINILRLLKMSNTSDKIFKLMLTRYLRALE